MVASRCEDKIILYLIKHSLNYLRIDSCHDLPREISANNRLFDVNEIKIKKRPTPKAQNKEATNTLYKEKYPEKTIASNTPATHTTYRIDNNNK